MFRRSSPNLDEVREKLMRLVGDYAGGIGMSREQVVSKAEKIITRDVAEQLDEATNKNAEASIQKLIGVNYFSTSIPFDVAQYLVIVVAVTELALRKGTTGLAQLRILAAQSGLEFYRNRYGAFSDTKDYQGAELMAQNWLVCVNLVKEPMPARMQALLMLSVAQYQQGKIQKAKENAEAVVAEYGKLSNTDKSSAEVQQLLNGSKQILSG